MKGIFMCEYTKILVQEGTWANPPKIYSFHRICHNHWWKSKQEHYRLLIDVTT